MRCGSLFSGIGGLELGLERAGISVAWQVETDEYCRRVLAKHWPDVKRHEDVRDVGAHNLESVDLICGGFPCPVVSSAARGRNVAEWLWPEFGRIVREVGPRYVLLENVEGLRYRDRGFGEILSDVAGLGFDAVWRDFPASYIGAPHKRARLWLVAYPYGDSEPDLSFDDEVAELQELRGTVRGWPDPPTGLRVDDGISPRTHRLRALGNAVVPQVAEYVGRRIVNAERTS